MLCKETEMQKWARMLVKTGKALVDPSAMTTQMREDDHPILRKEVEAAVQSKKKGKSAGVDNIPAELVKAVGEDVITTLKTI